VSSVVKTDAPLTVQGHRGAHLRAVWARLTQLKPDASTDLTLLLDVSSLVRDAAGEITCEHKVMFWLTGVSGEAHASGINRAVIDSTANIRPHPGCEGLNGTTLSLLTNMPNPELCNKQSPQGQSDVLTAQFLLHSSPDLRKQLKMSAGEAGRASADRSDVTCRTSINSDSRVTHDIHTISSTLSSESPVRGAGGRKPYLKEAWRQLRECRPGHERISL
jgi:hypothetical protein